MLYYPRWKIVLIAAIIAFGIIYSLPNILDKDTRAWMEKNAPFMPNQTVNLGLDLQGGAHILYNIDFDTVYSDHMNALADSLRGDLRDEGIVTSSLASSRDAITLKLSNTGDLDAARSIIRQLEQGLNIDTNGDVLTVTLDDSLKADVQNKVIAQTIEVVRRRVDETGTKEPVINRQGDTRVLVQVPGEGNPERIKALVGKTAQLGFHLVDERATRTGRGGAAAMVLPMRENPGQEIGIKRRAIITGEMLNTAAAGFNQGMPVVTFRFDSRGTDKFCRISRDNVGKPFAIVLDDVVISAPVIREPICGGQGQISGGFSVQEANDLALLLRAGALPAPLTIAEERSIGPSLGVDSIDAGKKAALVGFGFIILFMVVSYGTFGLISIISLLVNVIMVFGILTALQATLTLPGIAGIVLTIGMAVDANILIYERIREDYLQGRSVLGSIQSGFDNAFSTIIDANLTGLIAAILLYSFGTGPVKGFAVTLSVGILTTMFSAIMVTRLLIYIWSKRTGAKKLPLAEKEAA